MQLDTVELIVVVTIVLTVFAAGRLGDIVAAIGRTARTVPTPRSKDPMRQRDDA